MELLTEHQTARMLANGRATRHAQDMGEKEPDHLPVVKLFDPAGAATWLLTELDPETPSIAYGLCDLGMDCAELGSVSLYELESIVGKFGLRIERDLYFTATHPLSVYARAAWKVDRIVTDQASLEAAAKGGAQ